MPEATPRIRLLDPHLVNKIAAGEVIERPASVVKELLENALDATATRIDVAVQRGGLDLIRVTDNGFGIHPEELSLAVASHATSKLKTADDLFSISTKGFRGEALASIAEISHLLLRSRPADQPAGSEISVIGGVCQGVIPCPAPPGTTVEIRNLFFNTPVRRKFLRTTQTEMGHITEALTRVALAHTEVHFTLTHNERLLLDLPPTASWESRIAALCGDDVAEALIAVDRTEGDYRIHGFVNHPRISRANNRCQYFFLNRRHIRDRTLAHALTEAYRGLLLTGRMPLAFLHLELPPSEVDVNVHPTKLEVRFVDSGRVYSLLLGMLRSRFLMSDLSLPGTMPADGDRSATDSRWGLAPGPRADFSAVSPRASGFIGGGNHSPSSAGNLWGHAPSALDASALAGGRSETWPGGRAMPSERSPVPWEGPAPRAQPGTISANVPGDLSAATPSSTPSESLATTSLGTPAMQVCNRYLVTETEEGLVVIDQHALHERILYEELRQKISQGTLERQRLLVPEPVDLPPAEANRLLEHREFLMDLGIEIEPFSGQTLLVLSYPAILANLSPAGILVRVAERLGAAGVLSDRSALLDDVLHTIACKAAIKAGDRLTPQEVRALLDRRHLVHDAHHCPHGRPTTLVFTREQLDRQFKRT